jgi:hypothetical protein
MKKTLKKELNKAFDDLKKESLNTSVQSEGSSSGPSSSGTTTTATTTALDSEYEIPPAFRNAADATLLGDKNDFGLPVKSTKKAVLLDNLLARNVVALKKFVSLVFFEISTTPRLKIIFLLVSGFLS